VELVAQQQKTRLSSQLVPDPSWLSCFVIHLWSNTYGRHLSSMCRQRYHYQLARRWMHREW